jgi:hypothetical protein
MHYNIGQLVRITDAPDQPGWIRDFIGKIALIVDKKDIGNPDFIRLRYKVLIEDKVYDVHPLDLETINETKSLWHRL